MALENETRFSSVAYTAGRFTGKSIQHESADFYQSLDFLAQCCGKKHKMCLHPWKIFQKKSGMMCEQCLKDKYLVK